MHDDNGFDGLFREEPPPLTRGDVQREVINTLGAIQQSSALVAQRTQAAQQRAQEKFPEFQKLYIDRTVTKRFIKERPRTAQLIWACESGQGDPADLDEAYISFYNEARQYKSGSQPQQPSVVGSEDALKRINAMPLGPERHSVIQNLKDECGDTSIDMADPNRER
jgi:hypothetical protein